jgi:hypothetical protein
MIAQASLDSFRKPVVEDVFTHPDRCMKQIYENWPFTNVLRPFAGDANMLDPVQAARFLHLQSLLHSALKNIVYQFAQL